MICYIYNFIKTIDNFLILVLYTIMIIYIIPFFIYEIEIEFNNRIKLFYIQYINYNFIIFFYNEQYIDFIK